MNEAVPPALERVAPAEQRPSATDGAAAPSTSAERGAGAASERAGGADRAAVASVTVTFVTNNMKTVTAPGNSNLLRISLREQGGIPFKCGGGLCGTCRCRIESGLANTDAVKPKERRHLTEADLADGYRMACQTFVRGDIAVSWQPRVSATGGAVKP
jgi:ferredoxin